MKNTIDIKKILEEQVRPTIQKTLGVHGTVSSATVKESVKTEPKTVSKVISEALNVVSRTFPLKTEKLSGTTKSSHENLYHGYVDAFNKTSSALDAAARDQAKSSASAFRSLKDDETYNLNAIKLHELYFANISDVASEISMDSIPFMKLARDFGTFEKWQFDFMACAMSARNGWAVTVFDPYKNVFMNCVVDGHTGNVPFFTIPIIVLDVWEHAYFKDYADDKKSYIINMMRELNWDVIEARMAALDTCKLDVVYRMVAEHNPVPQQIAAASNVAPIDSVPPTNMNSAPGPQEPTAPPAPALSTPTPDKV